MREEAHGYGRHGRKGHELIQHGGAVVLVALRVGHLGRNVPSRDPDKNKLILGVFGCPMCPQLSAVATANMNSPICLAR